MNAFNIAMSKASRGLTWEYPCLIWVADYVRDSVGRDPAEKWRREKWTEESARRTLARLSFDGNGRNAVECVLSAQGWRETDTIEQGAVMVGVFDADGDVGVPALFDGERRWMHAGLGFATITTDKPYRMWVIE